MTDSSQQGRAKAPMVWLILGLCAGVATAVLAFTAPNKYTTVGAAATAIAAIVLTYIIAHRQDTEAKALSRVVIGVDEMVRRVDSVVITIDAAVKDIDEAVNQSLELTREMAERDSTQDYAPVLSEPVDNAVSVEGSGPDYEDEAIVALKSKGARLDYGHLKWQAKRPEPALPGNHGWFVESRNVTSDGRWFVRKANGMTVRKAMPRDLLEALEEQQQINPRTISLDYQLKEHGLAAWYARTYGGDLYKVWRSNRTPGNPIRTVKVDG